MRSPRVRYQWAISGPSLACLAALSAIYRSIDDDQWTCAQRKGFRSVTDNLCRGAVLRVVGVRWQWRYRFERRGRVWQRRGVGGGRGGGRGGGGGGGTPPPPLLWPVSAKREEILPRPPPASPAF